MSVRKMRLRNTAVGAAVTVVFGIASAGVLRAGTIEPPEASVRKGAALFVDKGCAHCHDTEKRSTKIGPGLKDLFRRDKLPVSGRPVTEENIRKQLETPYDEMPSFAGRLTKEETDDLLSYMKTL